MKKIFLFIVICACIFSSCKKKDDDKNCALTEANLTGSYKITSVTYKASASSPEQDYSDQFFDEPCQKDDILTIKSDHTYTYSDAGTVCSPSNDDAGDWSLSGNILSIDGDPAALENFNCSGFAAVGSDAIITGDKLSINFTKQ